jgi:hypothetical protein
MNIRKIAILFLIVLGISLTILSVTPKSAFAGAPPTGKEQFYLTPTKKHKKSKTPTKVPTVPTNTFTATSIFTSTSTSTFIPTNTSTITLIPSLIPSSTPTIVPYVPPRNNTSPCCPTGAIVLAGYAFFAVKNSRSKKTEI